jgi:hypothetical protein
MLELLGGPDRVDEESGYWGDSFIVNLGSEALTGKEPLHPHDLDNWHVDGDFFVHYLDSPEQALLVIPVFTDIHSRGGATYIAPEGIELVARKLAQYPEGMLQTSLSFTPSTSTLPEPKDDPDYWSTMDAARQCTQFVELTGEVGDVILLHPFMLHSASKNYLRTPRVITNPPVALRAPFVFDRENAEEYSLVERKTLLALGKDRFPFKNTTERRRVVPKRVLREQKFREEEALRLKEAEARRNGGNSLVAVAA